MEALDEADEVIALVEGLQAMEAVEADAEMEPCSSDSMDTVIIQPPDSAAHEQVAVPQLKRTDSILVLDFIREELESDSSEPELYSHTGSDTEYKPTQTASSSSGEEDLKSREKASSCEKLSSDEDQTASSSSDEDLKGAVEVLIGQTLMNDDDMAEKAAKKFLELLERN
ncbi:hypothetical protein SKAU_G00138610 [Synaphobranchus kaupii]|uniref:Uncharacterized protein n=1 Tax=Synaphobranchus kaupii TaxID=118154 RepID=A0A9Q1J475_SYNKA|nr:hypothetical protein SKAU_G00138610 [Synaphobranchus kaupii]